MKRNGTCMVVSLLVLSGLLAGSFSCAKPAPAPTPTPAPAPAPKPTATPTPTPAAAKPIEWKLANYMVPTHHITRNVFMPLVQEAEKRTGGRLKITLYNSGALGKSVDQYDAAMKGVADMTHAVQSFTPGRFPVSNIIELPFASPSGLVGTKAMWELYKKGHYDKEFAEVKVMAVWSSSSYPIFFSKKRPTSLDELKGLKVRSPGGYTNSTLEAAGMVAVPIPAGDMYMALQRGTVDGVAISYGSGPGYKLEELSKYGIDVSMGVVANVLAVNRDSWAKLPKDIQDIMDKLRDDIVVWAGNTYDAEDELGKVTYRKAGCEIYTLPPADRAKWIQLSKPTWDKSVKELEGKGLPGKAIYNDFLAILSNLGVKLPF